MKSLQSVLDGVIDNTWFSERRNEYLRWYPKSLRRPPVDVRLPELSLDGAYIHIPFCDRICKFCPFNKRLLDEDRLNEFVDALLAEIKLVSELSALSLPMEYLYFGGGTPSVLSPQQMQRIVDAFDLQFGLRHDAEISVEVHPRHANDEHLTAYRTAGVNRISMGIQSFRQDALQSLGAQHNADEAYAACEAAKRIYSNVAVDLLYAYPTQTPTEWCADLDVVLDRVGVPHLSCYALVPIDSDQLEVSAPYEVELALIAMERCELAGLEHYASCASGGFDVARTGMKGEYEFRHWAAPQSSFYGFGAGAFGYTGTHTTVNVLDTALYAEMLSAGQLPLASACPVSDDEAMRRYFALGVKCLDVPFSHFETQFGKKAEIIFNQEMQLLKALGMVSIDDRSMSLTPVGRLYVDSCSKVFFSHLERNVPHPEEPEIRQLTRLGGVNV